MDDFYNSLLEEMNEIVLHDKSINLTIILNEKLDVLIKEEKYEEARQKFQDAMNMTGYQCDIAYNIALCYYKLKQLAPSLKHIADIIEKGVREHPELGVGSNSEGVEVKSVGNT